MNSEQSPTFVINVGKVDGHGMSLYSAAVEGRTRLEACLAAINHVERHIALQREMSERSLTPKYVPARLFGPKALDLMYRPDEWRDFTFSRVVIKKETDTQAAEGSAERDYTEVLSKKRPDEELIKTAA